MSLASVIAFALLCMTLRVSPTEVSTCYERDCFMTPGEDFTRDFIDASKWCAEIGYELMVITNSLLQESGSKFLTGSQLSSVVYIAMEFKTANGTPTWYLLNGTEYQGNVSVQRDFDLGSKYYLFLDGKSEVSQFPSASNANELRNFICGFSASKCFETEFSTSLIDGRCYIKYEGEQTMSWFNARLRCVENGGELAVIQHADRLHSRAGKPWLLANMTYWIGVRWNDRMWKLTSGGGGSEVVYTNWAKDEPKQSPLRCVCVGVNTDPPSSWIGCDCNQTRPVVCYETTVIVPPWATPSDNESEYGRQMSHASTEHRDKRTVLGILLGAVFLIAVTSLL